MKSSSFHKPMDRYRQRNFKKTKLLGSCVKNLPFNQPVHFDLVKMIDFNFITSMKDATLFFNWNLI